MEELIITLCYTVPPVVLLLGILYLYLDKQEYKRKHKSSTEKTNEQYDDLINRDQQRMVEIKQRAECESELSSLKHQQRMTEINERAERERELLRQKYRQRMEQYQQSQDINSIEDAVPELSKNEITFLANKYTIELSNMITNIIHNVGIQSDKASDNNVQYDNNPVEEFVQDSIGEYVERQVPNVSVEPEVRDNVSNIDLNQYHAYNNEYNQPTYKKPSPVVSVGKDDIATVAQRSPSSFNAASDVAIPVLDKLRQEQSVHKLDNDLTDENIDDMKERLRLARNRAYLAPNKKLTPEGRYNHYVDQLTKKHNEYIDFKLRLNRTIRLAKDAGLTEEIIDDILNTGDKDKYIITGVNKYE